MGKVAVKDLENTSLLARGPAFGEGPPANSGAVDTQKVPKNVIGLVCKTFSKVR